MTSPRAMDRPSDSPIDLVWTGRRAALIAQDFLLHSGHVPVVVLILEALLARPGYFLRADGYLLVLAGIAQALAATLLRRHQYSRWVPLANLVGPLVYSLAETILEGVNFFEQWHHQAYWGFALGFAALHALQQRREQPVRTWVLAENVLRSAIPLVMYALFEARSQGSGLSLSAFLEDGAHDFLAIVLLLLGLLLGFADVNLRQSAWMIRELTARLQQYSEWSIGRNNLQRALHHNDPLNLQRRSRSVLFLDVRGFTAWSERRRPEEVVDMLNAYYSATEVALFSSGTIKIKFTADEVMAVFDATVDAQQLAKQGLTAAQTFLAVEGLGAGAGLHTGFVVEGLLGGATAKAYDFIGDTVNTAKRLCESAQSGELLISASLGITGTAFDEQLNRTLSLKGKRAPMNVRVVRIPTPKTIVQGMDA